MARFVAKVVAERRADRIRRECMIVGPMAFTTWCSWDMTARFEFLGFCEVEKWRPVSEMKLQAAGQPRRR